MAEHFEHPATEADDSSHPQEMSESSRSYSLADFPIELIQNITFFLDSKDDYVRLASTCRRLYHGLQLPPHDALDDRRLIVAHRLQLGWPDHWYCQTCDNFHRYDVSDLPTSFQKTLPSYSCPAADTMARYYTPLRSYLLCYRHVMQTLKYHAVHEATNGAGLNTQQRHKLRRLLSPHHTVVFLSRQVAREFQVDLPSTPPEVQYHHSVIPRVINGCYLLLSVWMYRGPPHRIREARDFCICKHQCTSRAMTAQFHARNGPSDGTAIGRPTYDDLRRTDVPLRPMNDDFWFTLLSRAEHEAFQFPGNTIMGSCPFCPTDFAVSVQSPFRLVFCCWQQMGTLDMREDDAASRVLAWDYSGPERVWHPHGSIRELFCAENHAQGYWFSMQQMLMNMEFIESWQRERFEQWTGYALERPRYWEQTYFRRFLNWETWQIWLQDPEAAANRAAKLDSVVSWT